MKIVAYLRVSSAEQAEGYSIEAQRHAIELQCRASGDEIVAECVDEGISAKFDQIDKRPGFARAVEEVEIGTADAIMVHKFDRAARHMLLFLSIMQRINGAIISVTQHANYATPEGRFFVHMLANMAQYYSDNLATEIIKGKQERKRQGYYNGRLPLGLRKQADDPHARKPPERDEAPAFTDPTGKVWSRWNVVDYIFGHAAAGNSTFRIAAELTALGFRTNQTAVWEVLNNRFYIGEIPECGKRKLTTKWLPGNQGVFVDPALFEKAAKTRERNRRGPGSINTRSRVYPLSGIARCGRCGSSMFNGQVRERWRLRCGGSQLRRDCDQPSILAEWIESQLLEYVEAYAHVLPRVVASEVLSDVAHHKKDEKAERATLQRRLHRLKDLYLIEDMSMAEYLRRKAELEQRIKMLDENQSDPDQVQQSVDLLMNLSMMYEQGNWEERNRLLSLLFTTAEVDGRQLVKVGFRPEVDKLWSLCMRNVTDCLG